MMKKKQSPSKMINVESSNIRSVGYEADRDILTVEFKNGRVFEYTDVPNQHFLNLLDAESKGKYFATHIKPHYKAKRIDDGK